MKFPLFSSLALALLLAATAGAQTAPAPQASPWDLSKDGKSLQVKAKCTTAELEAVCKAHAAEITTIRFDWQNKGIDSFAPLAQLKGLKSLHTMLIVAAEKKPFDLAPLSGLSELEELDFYATHVTNTQALAALKKVRELSFYMSDVDSIDCVKEMPNLEVLNLYSSDHKFKDYTPLLGLKKLRSLNIYMNPQAQDALLAPLSALTSLETIDMQNDSQITTLAFLKGSKGMKTIGATWCNKLKDIAAIKDMEQIVNLSLDDAPIADIAPLAGKLHLRNLRINGTKVSDLKPLETCPALDWLTIVRTPVTDLAPLAACKKLTRLEVGPTVPQEQIDRLKQAVPGLRVDVLK